MPKKEEQRLKKRVKPPREYLVIAYSFFALFAAMCIYFVHFLAVDAESFIGNSYNRRISTFSNTVIRGDIKTYDGVTLAHSTVDDEWNESRSYPMGNEYSHVVGFCTNGMSGIELDADFTLLRSHEDAVKQIEYELQGKKVKGDTVVTTLDSKLQDCAYRNLGTYDGAVIAMDPKTGRVLAMVSRPDFDPNRIEEDWEAIVSDSGSSVLLNRATQGLYPPGSTFKIVTTLAYLDQGFELTDTYKCSGSVEHDDATIHCYGGEVHGTIDVSEAFAESCNVSYAEMGLMLDADEFTELAEKLYFGRRLPGGFSNVSKSNFSIDKNDTGNIMQTAIGQGKLLVSPLHMSMITAAIANDGKLMEPYVIDHVENEAGQLVRRSPKISAGDIMSKDEAETMQELMRLVVTEGTATQLLTDDYDAYGKTGTAEFNSDKDASHSWFSGFATDGDKEIVVTVIMEGAGKGSAYAVPLAKRMFDVYFDE